MAGNIPNSRGDFDGKVKFLTCSRVLTNRIKSISQGIISKYKAENPDFDLDFESFAKEITMDEAVWIYHSSANCRP